MKVAIVGGGPAAFYVASRLLSRAPAARVHVFDRLWAPHGLVRYGVAPDHPEVKNCTHKFEAVAADPRFRFFGNVNVGLTPLPRGMEQVLQLPLADIQEHYSHLVFATGCPLPALHPALDPSPMCIPSLSFVHWYTQHPSAPPAPALERTRHVTLIGNGNVALDIARLLLTPVTHLEKYDVPQSVLGVLASSAVQHVSIVARRGPLQAAFTAKELREMLTLPDASMTPIPPALLTPPPEVTPTRQQSRILSLLAKGSTLPFVTTPKSWSLEFFKNPTGLGPRRDGLDLALEHTTLDSTGSAVPTGPAPSIHTDLVIPALGFRRAAGFPPRDLGAGSRVFAAGWALTGPKGVIADTMRHAYAVADALLESASSSSTEDQGEFRMNPSPPDTDDPPPAILSALSASAGGVVTSYADWLRIDAEEIRRGKLHGEGKERERMVCWEEARAFLRGPGASD
ncbi:hypothetical protein FB45DRAFT_910011 [Roridomyces roridus]|uniref:NADPH:adrenodoxin oxidoreductase, mitochondrial n=1 Tax=Roridomyces roridus TaxID=1738132 RepID=A0AAD7BZE0_9AGAR|nr:hypothetical protein FB45DRAFT_910011 [Roridomyces roridus]